MDSTNNPVFAGTELSASPANGLDVLLVDDEPDIELLAGEALRDAGHRVTAVKDGAEALELVRTRAFDLMICDIRLPKLDGLSLFRQTRQQSPDTTIILMTAFAEVQDAVAAVKEGAHDYLTKPFEIDEITLRVKRIAEHRALLRELEQRARRAGEGAASARSIVGRSLQMLRLLDRMNIIAPSHAPVLLQGESGTGKELVARALHDRSARRGKPFVAVNCGALPETLLEAELFGHERGAFTGAVKKRDGRFRAAARRHAAPRRGGGDVAARRRPSCCACCKKVSIEPLGTNESVRVDVRVISATNRNLKERVADGLFREDLYYRLERPQRRHPAAARAQRRPAVAGAVLLEKALAGRARRCRGCRRRPGPRCRSSRFRATCASSSTPSSTPWCWRATPTSSPAPARATSRMRATWSLAGVSPAPPAGRGAQGVRARVPAARAGRGRRQAYAGGRDPGHLAQEPVGEAPDARLLRLGQRAQAPACPPFPSRGPRYSWCAGGSPSRPGSPALRCWGRDSAATSGCASTGRRTRRRSSPA